MSILLALAFLIVPIVEIYLIIQVGQAVGAGWTILLLIADSLLGAWLVRHEGRRAWMALRQAIGSGRMPNRELADAGLILVGGTLLLTPGFLTDVVGFFLVLPVTRPVARRLLGWLIGRRLLGSGSRPVQWTGGSPGPPFAASPPRDAHPRGRRRGRVILGEVIEAGPAGGGDQGAGRAVARNGEPGTEESRGSAEESRGSAEERRGSDEGRRGSDEEAPGEGR